MPPQDLQANLKQRMSLLRICRSVPFSSQQKKCDGAWGMSLLAAAKGCVKLPDHLPLIISWTVLSFGNITKNTEACNIVGKRQLNQKLDKTAMNRIHFEAHTL